MYTCMYIMPLGRDIQSCTCYFKLCKTMLELIDNLTFEIIFYSKNKGFRHCVWTLGMPFSAAEGEKEAHGP